MTITAGSIDGAVGYWSGIASKSKAINVDHVWFGTWLKHRQMLSDLSDLVSSLLLDHLAVDCTQKQESANTELGLTPGQGQPQARFASKVDLAI